MILPIFKCSILLATRATQPQSTRGALPGTSSLASSVRSYIRGYPPAARSRLGYETATIRVQSANRFVAVILSLSKRDHSVISCASPPHNHHTNRSTSRLPAPLSLMCVPENVRNAISYRHRHPRKISNVFCVTSSLVARRFGSISPWPPRRLRKASHTTNRAPPCPKQVGALVLRVQRERSLDVASSLVGSAISLVELF